MHIAEIIFFAHIIVNVCFRIHKNRANLKHVSTREQLRHTSDGFTVQKMIDLDMAVLECYHRELS
jgi:hypothetical protein